jgi:hypothetical protein
VTLLTGAYLCAGELDAEFASKASSPAVQKSPADPAKTVTVAPASELDGEEPADAARGGGRGGWGHGGGWHGGGWHGGGWHGGWGRGWGWGRGFHGGGFNHAGFGGFHGGGFRGGGFGGGFHGGGHR